MAQTLALLRRRKWPSLCTKMARRNNIDHAAICACSCCLRRISCSTCRSAPVVAVTARVLLSGLPSLASAVRDARVTCWLSSWVCACVQYVPDAAAAAVSAAVAAARGPLEVVLRVDRALQAKPVHVYIPAPATAGIGALAQSKLSHRAAS